MKLLKIALIMLLATYASVELTRNIIYDYLPPFAPLGLNYPLVYYHIELSLIWIFYLIIPIALWRWIK